jgi:hypothetical protein
MKRLWLALALALASIPAYGQTVQYTAPVTRGHVPYWVSPGIIGDGGSSADSPLTSLGVTNEAGSALCASSQRQTAAGRVQLCLSVSTTGAAKISLQNYGTAAAQALQFVINGVTYSFPGSLTTITIGTTGINGGSNGNCLFDNVGTVGELPCTISAITSLNGDVSATGPGAAAATLATVNASPGTFGGAATIPIITVDSKGRTTTITTQSLALVVGTTSIQSGATNSILWQNGLTLSEITAAASSVLISSAGSVPSWATTLPSALTIPSALLSGVPVMAGLSAGSCTNALAIDGSNNVVKTSCPGAASSIQVGGTSITSGTPGNIEINNAGSLGEATPGNGIVLSGGTLGITSARRTLPTKQVFTSGSGTYTTPANVLWIEIHMIGGGAGGAGSGNSGISNGGNGGDTCWNTTGAACTTPVYQAGGGHGGTGDGGNGGTIAGTGACDWQVVGGAGGGGMNSISGTTGTPGGIGGASSLGAAGKPVFFGNGGAGGANSGAGGAGGGNSSAATNESGGGGGSGATCHVIINTPAASYTYAVGAAGSLGTGSTNGSNGGAGSTGLITVYEHYGS